MDVEYQKRLLDVYRDGLLNNTLPFWFPRCVDEDHGGFLLARDRDGSLLDDDKGMWQQCRATWFLATLYNTVEPNNAWLEWAKCGLRFIERHGRDSDGRMWFHVTRDGRPLRKRRYVFTECFGAIAYASLAKATGNGTLADTSRNLFSLAKRHFSDPPLIESKFTDTRPVKSIGVPMIQIVTAQELRLNLGDESFTADIDSAIEEIRQDFMKPELECVMETVAQDGSIIDHFEGRMLNPGHAIECAWFILWEARFRGNDPELIRTGCQILDWMWARGWDEKFGGLLYFRDLHGKPVQEYWHDMKFWWPHNEAIIACLLAWLLTGEKKYADWHQKVHDWAYGHFSDPEYGEWFGYLHRDGSVSVPLKGNLWKGPFHFPRMQLVCWKLLAESLENKASSSSAD
ncbi:MAG: AGE family epimerase/isomerase [Verrucomicrobiota bacterium]|jgi:N-acylglucosamine 2-epimerase|nr:AGE family epimerase/isomerase [Verrucomicrobiota bacterium]